MKKGFTLSEVLITLGIIGVVAAMTLPAVINNTQDKQFKAMFKKQYSALAQAILMVYTDGNDIPNLTHENWMDMSFYVCKISSQLKYLKSGLNCSTIEKLGDSPDLNKTDYFNDSTKWHNDGEWFNKKGEPQKLNSGYLKMTFLLPDESMINFNCLRDIFIDVNGYKKPNTIGRDIFFVTLPPGKLNLNFWDRRTFENDKVNSCTASYAVSITQTNYKDDCKNGSGWGCSPMYILD